MLNQHVFSPFGHKKCSGLHLSLKTDCKRFVVPSTGYMENSGIFLCQLNRCGFVFELTLFQFLRKPRMVPRFSRHYGYSLTLLPSRQYQRLSQNFDRISAFQFKQSSGLFKLILVKCRFLSFQGHVFENLAFIGVTLCSIHSSSNLKITKNNIPIPMHRKMQKSHFYCEKYLHAICQQRSSK